MAIEEAVLEQDAKAASSLSSAEAAEQHKKKVDAYNEQVTRWGLPLVLLFAISWYLKLQANTSVGKKLLHAISSRMPTGGLANAIAVTLRGQGFLVMFVVAAALVIALFPNRTSPKRKIL